MERTISYYDSPLGRMMMAACGESLCGLWFEGQKYFGRTLSGLEEVRNLPVFDETRCWLDMYFAGREPGFLPPLSWSDTPFREAVWRILLEIPFGQTRTYGDIAGELSRKLGIRSMSAQAVGGAVGHNPISLIVPCHRVVAADGSLTGYAGGMDKKAFLLKLERNAVVSPCEESENIF